jgi:hypothetical protein
VLRAEPSSAQVDSLCRSRIQKPYKDTLPGTPEQSHKPVSYVLFAL